jgi:cullin-4
LDHDAGLVAVVPSPPPAAGAITQAAVAPAPPPMASPAAGRAKKIRMNVDDKDVFIVDEKFRSQQRRIRINNILWKETMEEREKIVESVSRDRLYLIDAVLVRVLKARKTITHPQLMQQVMEQVKVPAQASDIKKRIESLIEREYMERDAEDRNRYNYLA